MFKATLKSLLAHKLRLALTSLAIVLGVGFVAGSLVLTDTLNETFIRLFKQVDGGVDVRVRSHETFSESQGGGGNAASKYQPVPASLVDEVRRVPGVNAVTGDISGYAQMVGRNGKVIGGAGPPTLGVAVAQDPALSRVTFTSGRTPANGNEVAIDAATAKKQPFKVGERVKILLTGPSQEFTISGVFRVGDADTLAGATIAAFDVNTAHQVLNRPGTFDAIDVKAEGASQTVVRDRISAALGGRYDVVTGQQLAAQEAQDVYNGFIKFIGTALLIFAGVALFVGTFIISNTFSIIVAGRTRELALLRALGAGRRQIMTSVLAEALITGLVSSLVGVAFGVLVATGLKAVLSAFGGKLPSSATVLAARTFVVSVVLGVLVTLVSALMPAIRATRIPPIAALRGEGLPGVGTGGVRRVRLVVGSLFLALGLGLLASGLFFGGGAAKVGLGAAAFIIGVAVLAVLVARTLAKIIGAPFARAFKLPGRLAQQNAMRNPARTSATAAALMIGLALVTFVSVFAASIKASLAASFDRSFAADYVIISNSFEGFSSAIGDDLRRVPQVKAVAALSGGQFRLDGKTTDLSASPLSTYASLIKLQLVDGKVPADNAGGLLVLDTIAKDRRWKVGDAVPMEFARTGLQQIPIAGIFKRNDFAGKYMLSTLDYARNFLNNQAEVVVVKAADGVPAAASRAAIEPVLQRYPNTSLTDQAQYKAKITSSVNQILALVTVLLLLAIVIAVIGIVNTLALSVLERTRELGLLRAVGMSRRQTRRMIRWESVIIAVIGATLGLLVGVFFGWALVRAIHDQGITNLAIPVGQLLSYVLAAAVFGVIAAILPARRAARLNVLAAIAYE